MSGLRPVVKFPVIGDMLSQSLLARLPSPETFEGVQQVSGHILGGLFECLG